MKISLDRKTKTSSETQNEPHDFAKQGVLPKSKSWHPLQSILLTITLFIGANFVAAAVTLLVAFTYSRARGDFDPAIVSQDSFLQFLFVVLMGTAVLLGVGFLLKLKKLKFRQIGLVKKITTTDVTSAFGGLGVYIILAFVAMAIVTLLLPGIDTQQEQQLGFDRTGNAAVLALAAISFLIVAPIVEEVLVRGYLFANLRARLPFLPTVLISATLFAVAHLQIGSGQPLLWIAAVDTFVLSLVLSYIREKTGSLAGPILLHAFKNAIAFSLVFILT